MHVLTNWLMRSTLECMFVTVDWVTFYLGALTWCICPTRVGTVGSCIAFEDDSPGVFLRIVVLQEEHSSNAGPTRANQMFGWSALSVSVGFCLGSTVTWQTLLVTETGRADQLFWRGWSLEGGLGCLSCMQ